MRIIGGKFKGRNLEFLKSKFTRPLRDSVKESIFNILNHSNRFEIILKNSNVLDLYSGIGSFGIECISRGSKTVTFFEKDNEVINLLKKNLTKLNLMNQTKVIHEDIGRLQSHINRKYDIFFLDPPYADDNYTKDLKKIKTSNFYKKKHIIIIHRENDKVDNLDGMLNLIMIRKYGRSKILFAKFI